MALAAALLIASGLMVRSVWNLQRIDSGMESSGVLTGRVQLHHIGLGDDDPGPPRQAFIDRLLHALSERPEVETVAVGSDIRGGLRSGTVAFAVSPADREAENPPVTLTGLLASLKPAVRASRVAPADALRHE